MPLRPQLQSMHPSNLLSHLATKRPRKLKAICHQMVSTSGWETSWRRSSKRMMLTNLLRRILTSRILAYATRLLQKRLHKLSWKTHRCQRTKLWRWLLLLLVTQEKAKSLVLLNNLIRIRSQSGVQLLHPAQAVLRRQWEGQVWRHQGFVAPTSPANKKCGSQ